MTKIVLPCVHEKVFVLLRSDNIWISEVFDRQQDFLSAAESRDRFYVVLLINFMSNDNSMSVESEYIESDSYRAIDLSEFLSFVVDDLIEGSRCASSNGGSSNSEQAQHLPIYIRNAAKVLKCITSLECSAKCESRTKEVLQSNDSYNTILSNGIETAMSFISDHSEGPYNAFLSSCMFILKWQKLPALMAHRLPSLVRSLSELLGKMGQVNSSLDSQYLLHLHKTKKLCIEALACLLAQGLPSSPKAALSASWFHYSKNVFMPLACRLMSDHLSGSISETDLGTLDSLLVLLDHGSCSPEYLFFEAPGEQPVRGELCFLGLGAFVKHIDALHTYMYTKKDSERDAEFYFRCGMWWRALLNSVDSSSLYCTMVKKYDRKKMFDLIWKCVFGCLGIMFASRHNEYLKCCRALAYAIMGKNETQDNNTKILLYERDKSLLYYLNLLFRAIQPLLKPKPSQSISIKWVSEDRTEALLGDTMAVILYKSWPYTKRVLEIPLESSRWVDSGRPVDIKYVIETLLDKDEYAGVSKEDQSFVEKSRRQVGLRCVNALMGLATSLLSLPSRSGFTCTEDIVQEVQSRGLFAQRSSEPPIDTLYPTVSDLVATLPLIQKGFGKLRALAEQVVCKPVVSSSLNSEHLSSKDDEDTSAGVNLARLTFTWQLCMNAVGRGMIQEKNKSQVLSGSQQVHNSCEYERLSSMSSQLGSSQRLHQVYNGLSDDPAFIDVLRNVCKTHCLIWFEYWDCGVATRNSGSEEFVYRERYLESLWWLLHRLSAFATPQSTALTKFMLGLSCYGSHSLHCPPSCRIVESLGEESLKYVSKAEIESEKPAMMRQAEGCENQMEMFWFILLPSACHARALAVNYAHNTQGSVFIHGLELLDWAIFRCSKGILEASPPLINDLALWLDKSLHFGCPMRSNSDFANEVARQRSRVIPPSGKVINAEAIGMGGSDQFGSASIEGIVGKKRKNVYDDGDDCITGDRETQKHAQVVYILTRKVPSDDRGFSQLAGIIWRVLMRAMSDLESPSLSGGTPNRSQAEEISPAIKRLVLMPYHMLSCGQPGISFWLRNSDVNWSIKDEYSKLLLLWMNLEKACSNKSFVDGSCVILENGGVFSKFCRQVSTNMSDLSTSIKIMNDLVSVNQTFRNESIDAFVEGHLMNLILGFVDSYRTVLDDAVSFGDLDLSLDAVIDVLKGPHWSSIVNTDHSALKLCISSRSSDDSQSSLSFISNTHTLLTRDRPNQDILSQISTINAYKTFFKNKGNGSFQSLWQNVLSCIGKKDVSKSASIGSGADSTVNYVSTTADENAQANEHVLHLQMFFGRSIEAAVSLGNAVEMSEDDKEDVENCSQGTLVDSEADR